MPEMLATYKTSGNLAYPSPSVWADCPVVGFINNATGVFIQEDFHGAMIGTMASGLLRPRYGAFSLECDDDTVITLKAAEEGGYIDLQTTATDDESFSIFTEPFCKIVKGSGKRIWLETRMEFGLATGQQGFFFGLAEEAALSKDIVSDGCTGLITETLIGFRLFDEEDAVDFVAQLDTGDETIIVSDVTNQSVLDDVLGSGSAASLASDTEMKFGLVFDGDNTVKVYMNGVEIAAWTLDSTYFDLASPASHGVIMSLKSTDNSTADSIAVDWVRAAYEY